MILTLLVAVAGLVSTVSAPGVAGWYVRRRTDAETVKTTAEAGRTRAEADKTIGETYQGLLDRVERELHRQGDLIKQLTDEVSSSRVEHEQCQHDLAQVRRRVRSLEQSQQATLEE